MCVNAGLKKKNSENSVLESLAEIETMHNFIECGDRKSWRRSQKNSEIVRRTLNSYICGNYSLDQISPIHQGVGDIKWHLSDKS